MAAISVSALLIGLAALILFAPGSVWAALIIFAIGFALIESLLRGSYTRMVNRLAVILALIAVVVLAVEYWKLAIVAALVALAIFLIVQRVRELRS